MEVHNSSAQSVDLTHWRIRLGVDYNFDDGVAIGVGETMLVVGFNPDNPANSARLNAFRTHYGLADNVQIVGGLGGQLSNTGEGVRLVRPGTPPADDPTSIPRFLEDEVVYDNVAPWPTDALGLSLQRTATNAYGNDAASWIASAATPGQFGGERPGDLTGDGLVDLADVEALRVAVLNNDLAKDLTGDGAVNTDDTVRLVEVYMGSSIGDVTGDRVFNSQDLVALFINGEYQDDVAGNSLYAEGDWDMDGDFTTSDFVFALQRGALHSWSSPIARFGSSGPGCGNRWRCRSRGG